MERLPLPQTRQGWVAAVLLTVCAFIIYYWCMFPALRTFYENALYTAESSELVTAGCSDKELQILKEIRLRISSPLYIAPSGARWFYVTIRNGGKRPIEDIKLWLELFPGKEIEEPAQWSLPFLFAGSSVVEQSIEFARVEPYSTVAGRFPLYATSEATGTLWLRLHSDCKVRVETASPLQFKINPLKYLAHSLVENILLPPWSNGVLVGMVLFTCYIAERNQKKRDHELTAPLIDTALIGYAAQYLAITWAVVLIIVSLPWLFSWKGILLVLVSVVFLVLFGVSKGDRLIINMIILAMIILAAMLIFILTVDDVESLLEIAVVFLAGAGIVRILMTRGGSHASNEQPISPDGQYRDKGQP